MNKMKLVGFFVTLILAMTVGSALAVPTKTQVEFLINGDTQSTTGIDSVSGLGTRTFNFSAAGTYDVRSFFDLDLSLATTGFFNEFGLKFNSTKLEQSWEIDEPGYWIGNLYANFNGAGFDNSIGTDNTNTGLVYPTEQNPDDVAVGMGWKFVLNSGYKATLNFVASETAPTSPDDLFYIGQFDASEENANDPVYFYSTLKIEPDNTNPVPEPSTFALLGLALGGAAIFRKRLRG